MYLCWKCGTETKNDDDKECPYCGAKKVDGEAVINEQWMQQCVRKKIQKERILVTIMLTALVFLAFMITNG